MANGIDLYHFFYRRPQSFTYCDGDGTKANNIQLNNDS